MKTYEFLFRVSAIFMLVLTAAAKLLSASGRAPLLDWPDPLFGLANRQLLILVGSVELGVAVGLVSPLSTRVKHLLLAWLSANFLLYRLAFHVISPGKACPCLGTLTEKLHISPSTVNLLLSSVVVYLLVGSACMLIYLRWRRTSLAR